MVKCSILLKVLDGEMSYMVKCIIWLKVLYG